MLVQVLQLYVSWTDNEGSVSKGL